MNDLSGELKGWIRYVTDPEQGGKAKAIRRRLHDEVEQYLKVHPCPSCELADTEKDNFLRGSFIENGRLRHLVNTDRIALSYWRHGHGGSCLHEKDEEFEQLMHCHPFYNEWMGGAPITIAGSEMQKPGMGLEEECFNSFLAYSVKERLIHRYIIETGMKTQEEPKYYVAQSQDELTQKDTNLLAEIAGNIVHADHTLNNLAQDPDPMVRAAVASNINTPLETLSTLSGDCHPLIRCALALNSSAPDNAVKPLLSDQDPDVVRAAIKHFEMKPACTEGTQTETVYLSPDFLNGAWVRQVIENPNTPADTVRQLNDICTKYAPEKTVRVSTKRRRKKKKTAHKMALKM